MQQTISATAEGAGKKVRPKRPTAKTLDIKPLMRPEIRRQLVAFFHELPLAVGDDAKRRRETDLLLRLNLLSPEMLCAVMAWTPKTLANKARSELPAFYKIGERRLFPLDGFRAWLARREVER